MNSIEVAYLYPSFVYNPGDGDPICGGAERHFRCIARALTRYVRVRAVAFGPEDVRDDSPQLKFRILKGWPMLRSMNGVANPISLQALKEIVQSDVIQCQGTGHDLTLCASILARTRGIPLAVKDDGWKGAAFARFFNTTWLADVVTIQTRFEEKLYGNKARLCYDGVDVEQFHPARCPSRDYFLFVGRIIPSKGIERAIMSIKTLGGSLRIAGPTVDRDYCNYLKWLAKGADVEFLGQVSDCQLGVELSNACALVLPFRNRDMFGHFTSSPELFGLVVAEAMASGTPVVCSSGGGPAELVREFQCGFVVDQDDESGLTDALSELRENVNLREMLGRRGRHAAETYLTWDAVARRYAKVYSELASRRSLRGRRADTTLKRVTDSTGEEPRN